MKNDQTHLLIKLLLTALLGGTGIMLAALGAHYMKGRLSDSGLDSFDTAVNFQILHGIVLLSITLFCFAVRKRAFGLTFWLIFAGTAMFSGSIYLLLMNMRFLWFVTPLGGILTILGWLSIIPQGYRYLKAP